jgi:hypothetical protein
MKHLLLPLVLGLLAPFVYILGAAPFEIPGQNSPQEIVAGSFAVALFFAASHFLLLRKEPLASRAHRLVPVVLVLSLLAVSFLISLQGGQAWLYSGLPLFIGGCVGVLAGVLISRRPLIFHHGAPPPV